MTQIPVNNLRPSNKGRNGGTWLHPKLAIRFARWLSVDFEVWCDLMIDNILKGNIQTTVVVPTEEALSQMMGIPLNILKGHKRRGPTGPLEGAGRG